MKDASHILRLSNEPVWTIKEKGLSENAIRVLESGFPDKWIVLFEDAYGKLKVSRMNKKQLEARYGIMA